MGDEVSGSVQMSESPSELVSGLEMISASSVTDHNKYIANRYELVLGLDSGLVQISAGWCAVCVAAIAS